MNKIKKVFISFGAFFTGLVSKVFAANIPHAQSKYGIFEPEPTMGERILSVGKFALPVILFVIGLFVVLSKKITKKIKVIVISVLFLLAVLGYAFMYFIKLQSMIL